MSGTSLTQVNANHDAAVVVHCCCSLLLDVAVSGGYRGRLAVTTLAWCGQWMDGWMVLLLYRSSPALLSCFAMFLSLSTLSKRYSSTGKEILWKKTDCSIESCLPEIYTLSYHTDSRQLLQQCQVGKTSTFAFPKRKEHKRTKPNNHY